MSKPKSDPDNKDNAESGGFTLIVYPFKLAPWEIDTAEPKALFCGVIYYYSFCRFPDFTLLKDNDFNDKTHFITINFRQSKFKFFQGSLRRGRGGVSSVF